MPPAISRSCAAVSGDPVRLGLVDKPRRHPGGNVTGFTTFNDTLAAKRFELLHEIAPTMHIAALMCGSGKSAARSYSKCRRKKRRRPAGSNCSVHCQSQQRAISTPALAIAHNRHASAIIVGRRSTNRLANGRAIIAARCVSLTLPACTRSSLRRSRGVDVLWH